MGFLAPGSGVLMEGPREPGKRGEGRGQLPVPPFPPFPARPGRWALRGGERRLRGAGELDTRAAGAMGAGPWARES